MKQLRTLGLLALVLGGLLGYLLFFWVAAQGL